MLCHSQGTVTHEDSHGVQGKRADTLCHSQRAALRLFARPRHRRSYLAFSSTETARPERRLVRFRQSEPVPASDEGGAQFHCANFRRWRISLFHYIFRAL